MKRIFLIMVIMIFSAAGLCRAEIKMPRECAREKIGPDPAGCIKTLKAWARSNQRDFLSAEADYLLARLLERDGKASEALDYYRSSVNRDSNLRDHAAYHAALILFKDGKYYQTKAFLSKIINTRGGSIFIDEALVILAKSYFDPGEYKETLEACSITPRSSPWRERIGGLCIQAALNSRNLGVAADRLKKIDAGVFGAREILDAVRALEAAYEKSKTPIPDDIGFLIARVFFENRKFEDAFDRFKPLAQPGSKFRAEACYFSALILERVDYHSGALEKFLCASDSGTGKNYEPEYYAGKLMVEVFDDPLGIEKLRDVWESSHPMAGDALLAAARFYAKRGEGDKIDKLLERVKQRFSGKPVYARARLIRAYMELDRGLAARALKLLDEIMADKSLGEEELSEALFWKGFAAEMQGNMETAQAAWLRLLELYPRNFWALRAAEKLRSAAVGDLIKQASSELKSGNWDRSLASARKALLLYKDSSRRDEALSIMRRACGHIASCSRYLDLKEKKLEDLFNSSEKQNPHVNRGIILYRLGLVDETEREFSAIDTIPGDPVTAYTLALIYGRAGMVSEAALWAIKARSRLLKKGLPPGLIPHDLDLLQYPKPFSGEVNSSAKKFGIEPDLLWALMREESLFDPLAAGNQSDMGLMQFLPETAEKIAGELGRKFDKHKLMEPDYAILLGARYLSDLLNLFGGGMAKAVAAYNAGKDKVEFWISDCGGCGDELVFIRDIPNAVTRAHVMRVLYSYETYKNTD